MSKEDFIKQFAAKRGWTVDEFHQRMVVVSCKCTDSTCRGWRPELKNRPRLEDLSMIE